VAKGLILSPSSLHVQKAKTIAQAIQIFPARRSNHCLYALRLFWPMHNRNRRPGAGGLFTPCHDICLNDPPKSAGMISSQR
jgi:hypothetical protein